MIHLKRLAMGVVVLAPIALFTITAALGPAWIPILFLGIAGVIGIYVTGIAAQVFWDDWRQRG